MSDYELQVGDPVLVEVHKKGHHIDTFPGYVVKFTDKRIGVAPFRHGRVRYFSPDHVSLNKTALLRSVEVLMNRRQHTNSVQGKRNIDAELENLRAKL